MGNNNNNNNNGYDNPYNPYNSNDNYNYNNSFNNNQSPNEDDERQRNKKVGKKVVTLSKFLGKTGLKIILANVFLLMFFYTIKDYSDIIGFNNNLYIQNGMGYVFYSKIFLALYIIFIIIHYYFKYFKKRTNWFAFSGVLVILILFGSLPFTCVTKYTYDDLQIKNFFSTKVLNYKDVKDVTFAIDSFDYRERNGWIKKYDNDILNEGYIFQISMNNGFGYSIDEDFTYLDLQIYTLEKFQKIENKFPNSKVTYLLYDNDNGDKEVSREEFYQNIDKYKPYISKTSQYDIMNMPGIYGNANKPNPINEFIIKLLIDITKK